jgi:hypothetical protein
MYFVHHLVAMGGIVSVNNMEDNIVGGHIWVGIL